MRLMDNACILTGVYGDINTTGFDTSTYALGDYVNVKNYGHATFIISFITQGGTPNVGIYQCDDPDTLTNEKVVLGTTGYKMIDTSARDADATALTFSATTGLVALTAVAKQTVVMEIDTAAMDTDNGFIYLKPYCSAPSAAAVTTCVYILTEPRYAPDHLVIPVS